MNKTKLIGKLNMIYVGDKNALDEMVSYYDWLQEENEKLSLIRNKALNWFACPDMNKLQNLLNILRGEDK